MAQRPKSVTIRHVAADAGVSLQTVSRVINKEPNVRAEMLARVQASIDKLGYVPSIAAQRLAGSRSYLILALNDRERTVADWRERQGTDWIDQMLLGGMMKGAEHGYRLLVELIDTHGDHIERELLAALAAVRPDGVILTPPHSQNPVIADLLERHGIRFARIGSLAPGPGFRIIMDDEASAARATEHLLSLGHRRIGFISGPPDYELSGWRVDGWRAAMTQAGIPTDDLLQPGDFTRAGGARAARALLDLANPVTAIIASNDRMALAALETVGARNLIVPDDISLVSFDDTPMVRLAHPALTAVVQPIAESAARAMELLIDAGAGREPEEAIVVVPASFEVRGSTATRR